MRYESNTPLNVVRGFFVIAAASLGWSAARAMNLPHHPGWFDGRNLLGLGGGLVLSILTIAVEARAGRGFYPVVFAIVFGLLVGFISANFFLQGLELLPQFGEIESHYSQGIRTAVTTLLCYLAVSLFLKAKDEFMLLVPFVRFTQQERLKVPRVLDLSALVDGRIADLVRTNLLEGPLLVPRFVLEELQKSAEDPSRPARQRARRGLEILQRLQEEGRVPLSIEEEDIASEISMEQKIVEIAKRRGAQVLTADHRVKTTAELVGVRSANLNEVAASLRVIVLPGEEVRVKLLREGENPGQALGYLSDGSLVVVEGARERIGQEVEVEVTSALQKPQGRLVFGRIKG